MQAFGSMLQQNQSLTELDISECVIDIDTVCYLAEGLHHNTLETEKARHEDEFFPSLSSNRTEGSKSNG